MADTFVTCSKCNRVVKAEHVNSSGRCVDCAGSHTPDAPEKAPRKAESES